jgi:putative membrane protein
MCGLYGTMMGPWSILLWIVLLAAIVLVIYQFTKAGRQAGSGENPRDILKTRYAKGEITKEEFEEKKKDLGL